MMMEKLGMDDLASKIVFVAGHRVTTDPVAIPFSIGCNLLCIFSKKYIEVPPELKASKQQRNMVRCH
jgi:glycerol-3-phosphate O-acyltransferase